MERVTGFEPVFPVWETGVLPLDDTRVSTSGGIRTLATRLRGGCSTYELRRRVPPLMRAGGASPLRFSCQRAAAHCEWGGWELNPEGPVGLRLYRPTRLRNALRPQMGEAGNARGREPFREPGLRRTASRLEAEHQKRLGCGSQSKDPRKPRFTTGDWQYRDCEEGAGKALTRTLRKPAGLLWCFGFIVPGFIVVVRIVTAPFT